MTIRSPLAVRVATGTVDRHVTKQASGLKFTKKALGGYAGGEVRIASPRDEFNGTLGGGDHIWVYAPDGRTLIEGYCDNPGRGDGRSGQDHQISFLGTQSLAQDQRHVLFYRDTDLGSYEEFAASKITQSQVTTSEDPDAAIQGDGLLTQLTAGQAVGTNAEARGEYRRLLDAGLEVGAITATVKSGKTDANYRTELPYGGTGGTGFSAHGANMNPTAVAFSRYVGESGHFPIGTNRIGLRLRRSGAATNILSSDDTTWTWWHNVAVLMRRMTRYGVPVTGVAGMVTAAYVRADWVVEDLIGRMFNGLIDPAIASVVAETIPTQIDQLTFPDGATAADVLNHLATQIDYLWSIGAGNPDGSGGYAFSWHPWPTEPRYEISTADGFDQPGGEYELCNRILVTWGDAAGRKQSLPVTVTSADYPELADLERAGRIRDAETIDLPDGRGSAENAQRIGEQILGQRATAPRSATATVRHPIRDRLRGGWVEPYAIEPGYPVVVRETGETLRLTEMTFDDADNASTSLVLGNPVLSEDELIARLPIVRRRTA